MLPLCKPSVSPVVTSFFLNRGFARIILDSRGLIDSQSSTITHHYSWFDEIKV